MRYNGVELFEEFGVVTILVSPGFGAGWSTWNDERIAYDKRVVEYFNSHPPKLDKLQLEKARDFLDSIGYEGTYMGGYNQIVKKEVEVGKPFRIVEYDGSEGIMYADDLMVFT